MRVSRVDLSHSPIDLKPEVFMPATLYSVQSSARDSAESPLVPGSRYSSRTLSLGQTKSRRFETNHMARRDLRWRSKSNSGSDSEREKKSRNVNRDIKNCCGSHVSTPSSITLLLQKLLHHIKGLKHGGMR